MTGIFTSLFLLQRRSNSLSDFNFGGGQSGGSRVDNIPILIGLGIIAAIVIILLVVNRIRKGPSDGAKGKGGKTKGAGASTNPRKMFSSFKMHRIARELGLNHEQSKMLTFVFKEDGVTDPEKSVASPTLLDRHFRRAYRIISSVSGNDENTQNRLAVMFSTRNRLENSSAGGIGSTKQLTDEMSVSFNFGRDKYSAPVLSAKGDNLAIECPKSVLGSQVKIPRGSKLPAFIFTKNNKGFSFEAHVAGYNTTLGHSALLLAHSNKLKFLSQRRFRRRQTLIACFLYLVYVEGNGKKQKLRVDKRRITGNIADISIGGCSIKTTSAVQGGARIKLEFSQGEISVAALGQVLRTNRTGMNVIAHVKFLKVTRKSMNLINAFVYEYVNE